MDEELDIGLQDIEVRHGIEVVPELGGIVPYMDAVADLGPVGHILLQAGALRGILFEILGHYIALGQGVGEAALDGADPHRHIGCLLYTSLGENDRGTLYGVYGLLEDYLGCRFLTPEVEKIPRRSGLALPELDVTRIPPLEYRETFWHGPEMNPLFAVKRGLNGSIFNNYPEKVGGGIQYYYFGHSFFQYVSPDEYFDLSLIHISCAQPASGVRAGRGPYFAL